MDAAFNWLATRQKKNHESLVEILSTFKKASATGITQVQGKGVLLSVANTVY
jgi:hypothetical protein